MKRILLRVTKLKTHFLHFSARKVDINGWGGGGQEKLAGLVHPAACWHVFKWPSFLETKRLAVSLLGNVMWLADGYLSTAASAIHLVPQQCPCWGICCIFHSVITWFGIPRGEKESLAGKTMGCTNLAGKACTSVPLLTAKIPPSVSAHFETLSSSLSLAKSNNSLFISPVNFIIWFFSVFL